MLVLIVFGMENVSNLKKQCPRILTSLGEYGQGRQNVKCTQRLELNFSSWDTLEQEHDVFQTHNKSTPLNENLFPSKRASQFAKVLGGLHRGPHEKQPDMSWTLSASIVIRDFAF